MIEKALTEFNDFLKDNNSTRLSFYKSMYDIVLKEGKEYLNSNLNLDQKYLEFKKDKSCFENSFKLSSKYKELTYCEGYAVSDKTKINLPLLHAWCLDKSNNVIDPTWHKLGIENSEYYGIEFSNDFVSNYILKLGTYSSILDCWELKWFIYEKEFKNEWSYYFN